MNKLALGSYRWRAEISWKAVGIFNFPDIEWSWNEIESRICGSIQERLVGESRRACSLVLTVPPISDWSRTRHEPFLLQATGNLIRYLDAQTLSDGVAWFASI